MERVGLEEGIRRLCEATYGVKIVGHDPDEVRSNLGDLLARRPSGQPSWWQNNNNKPSPYRIFPDSDQMHLHIVWLKNIDEDMRSLVSFAYPDAVPVDFKPDFTYGDSILLEVIQPIYFSYGMMNYMRSHHQQVDLFHAPDLNILMPFLRKKFSTFCRHWLNYNIHEDVRVYYQAGSLTKVLEMGNIMEIAHRTHKTGFVIKNQGFVGQAIYQGEANVIQNAHAWLQAGCLWGIASGTTWGWSTVWEMSKTLGLDAFEDDMVI